MTQREKAELQDVVDAQELSPADIDRMTAERDQLAKNLEQYNEREDQVKNSIWEFEVACQKKLDQVDKRIKDFNDRAYRLELIPASAKHANGLNFEISFNRHATRADQMIAADIRGTVKVRY
jgi:kinetochore protein NDC80